MNSHNMTRHINLTMVFGNQLIECSTLLRWVVICPLSVCQYLTLFQLTPDVTDQTTLTTMFPSACSVTTLPHSGSGQAWNEKLRSSWRLVRQIWVHNWVVTCKSNLTPNYFGVSAQLCPNPNPTQWYYLKSIKCPLLAPNRLRREKENSLQGF